MQSCVWMRGGLAWHPVSQRETGDRARQGRWRLGEGRCVWGTPRGPSRGNPATGVTGPGHIGPGGWRQSPGRHLGARFLQLDPRKEAETAACETLGPVLGAGRPELAGAPRGAGGKGHCPGGRLRSAPTRPPGSTSGTGPGAAGHLSGVPLRGSRRSLWDHLSLRALRTVKTSESGPVSCHLLPAKQRGHHVTTSHGWPPPGLLCGWGLLEKTHWDPAAS